jgi:hypothetical protein
MRTARLLDTCGRKGRSGSGWWRADTSVAHFLTCQLVSRRFSTVRFRTAAAFPDTARSHSPPLILLFSGPPIGIAVALLHAVTEDPSLLAEPQVCVPAACQVPRLRPHSGPNPRPGYRRQHRDLQPHPWRAHPALSPLRARDRDPERLPHPAPTTPPPGPTLRSGVPSPPASPDLWPASPAA